MLTLNCLKMYVKMPVQPLHQSLTLTSYTQLKASAYLHLRVCHCLACRGVRIFHQHQECPGSLWKLVCRKEEVYFLNVGKNIDTEASDTSERQFIRQEVHWLVAAPNTTDLTALSPCLVHRPHTGCNYHMKSHGTSSSIPLSPARSEGHTQPISKPSAQSQKPFQSPPTNTKW